MEKRGAKAPKMVKEIVYSSLLGLSELVLCQGIKYVSKDNVGSILGPCWAPCMECASDVEKGWIKEWYFEKPGYVKKKKKRIV